MPIGWLVERGADDFRLDGALHIGDFFGSLVDEQHDEPHLGMVPRNAVGDFLQQDCFAALWGRYDETALTLPDRCEHVNDAHREFTRDGLELELLGGIGWGQVIEERAIFHQLWLDVVDRLDLEQREETLAFLRWSHVPSDGIARAQAEALDLRGRHVDVIGRGQVVVIGRAQESVAFRQHFEHTGANCHSLGVAFAHLER